MKEELTEHQRKALQYATKEWFNPESCNNEFFFRVRRPYFTATKLYEKGYLERKVTGPEGMPYFVFRLVPVEEEMKRIHEKECRKHGVGQLDADEHYTEP